MADSAVAWTELAGSPTESYTPGNVTAQRLFKCPWDDRYTLRNELLGDAAEFGGNTWIQYPGFDSLLVHSVHIEPFHDDQEHKTQTDLEADLAEYCNYAQLTVDYVLMPVSDREVEDIEDGTFLTYSMDYGGEIIEVDRGSLYWEGAVGEPVKKEAKPTLYIPIIEHHITWHRVINPPWGYISAATGCVNSAEFMGAAADTVLFAGCKAVKDFTLLEQLETPEFGWKLEYLFREKTFTNYRQAAPGIPGLTYGWNHQPRTTPAGTFVWDRLLAFGALRAYWGIPFGPLFQFAAIV